MKKAEEWVKEFNPDFNLETFFYRIQIDAIEVTVLKCAQLGMIDDGQYYLIAEQLKKELE